MCDAKDCMLASSGGCCFGHWLRRRCRWKVGELLPLLRRVVVMNNGKGPPEGGGVSY